jgi:hypothetical protein
LHLCVSRVRWSSSPDCFIVAVALRIFRSDWRGHKPRCEPHFSQLNLDAILNGRAGMLAYDFLSDQEIADVLAYVRATFDTE